jgi:mannitol-1-phosphate 5-dehydrogenase
MKGLIFGAGNIGRGFLGLLLTKNGFDVTFVDVDSGKIAALHTEHGYPVFVVSADGIGEETVANADGILATDVENIERAIVEADLILTAVGKDALQYLAPNLARGLLQRMKLRPKADMHVAVVACENVQDNTIFLRDHILKWIPDEQAARFIETISFPNCVVDRIVPNTLPRKSESVLAVAVEEYFQLAIDGEGLKGPFPSIAGIDISSNLGATLEQKLCTLNMAHAIVGYFGYLRGHTFVHEAVADADVSQLLAGALQEVSLAITGRHSSITPSQQGEYARKVVTRFKNPHLRDEIVRVARQPRRKLGPGDRLIKPALLSASQGNTPAFLASGITAALHYDYGADAEAQELTSNIREHGIERVLQQVTGLTPENNVARLVKANFLLRAL